MDSYARTQTFAPEPALDGARTGGDVIDRTKIGEARGYADSFALASSVLA
jgi:hypothetical protein